MTSLIRPKSPTSGKPKNGPTADSFISDIRSKLSSLQLSVIDNPKRFKVARCGRRAGKTHLVASYMVIKAIQESSQPIVYFGLTRDSAKEAVWEPLMEVLYENDIPCEVSEASLTIKFPNKSKISLYGMDMQKMADRFRGRKYALICIDECAFYVAVDTTVSEVLLPTIADLAGTILMTSSPGKLPSGLFYDADMGKKQGQWVQFHWTLRDNPHFQGPALDPKYANRAEEELAIACEMKFEGDVDAPGFRREYLGQWVFDAQAQAYPIDKSKFVSAETDPHAQYILSLNLSQYGRQGFVVLKYSEYSREVTIIEAQTLKLKNLDTLAGFLHKKTEDYPQALQIGYVGSYTPNILDEFRTRYGSTLSPCAYPKTSFNQSIAATDISLGYVLVSKECPEIMDQFAAVMLDEDGEEIPGQNTLLTDAFFAAYLSLYNSHLKTIKRKPTMDELLEQSIIDRHYQELANEFYD